MNDQRRPRFSLIIPAYNEGQYLPALLDSVDVARKQYAGGADRIEVIVGNNASTDATAGIASQRGCQVAHVEKRCIAAARNGGAKIAQGEILCFVDADYRIAPDTFNAIDEALLDGRVAVGVSGFRWPRWSLGILITLIFLIPTARFTRTDLGMMFCSRRDFDAVGGFNENLLAGEDMDFQNKLKDLGRPEGRGFRRLRGVEGIASTRKLDKRGDWFYVWLVFRTPYYMVFKKSMLRKQIRDFWYEDR